MIENTFETYFVNTNLDVLNNNSFSVFNSINDPNKNDTNILYKVFVK